MTADTLTMLTEQLGTPLDVLKLDENSFVALWQPVYDRTLTDCVYGNEKGSLGFKTLNRICANAEYIKESILSDGDLIDLSYVADVYAREDYIFLDDINKLIEVYNVFQHYLNMGPLNMLSSNNALSYTTVNELEKIIADTQGVLENMRAAYVYADEIFSGELETLDIGGIE